MIVFILITLLTTLSLYDRCIFVWKIPSTYTQVSRVIFSVKCCKLFRFSNNSKVLTNITFLELVAGESKFSFGGVKKSS